MQGKYFEELEVGDEFISPRRTITETDIVSFTSLCWLNSAVFTDEIFAKEKGFGTRVAPGPLAVCYALGLTDEIVYGTAVAALGIDGAKFIAPVKPGDTIHVKTTIIRKRESASKPDRGIVSLRHEIYNQRGEQVCVFERTLMILKKPQ